MQLNQPKTIYLKDYRAPNFTVEEIDLTVDIGVEKTLVSSKLKLKKLSLGTAHHLELNGENLKLLSISLDGQPLSSDAYQLSEDKLVILNLQQENFILEIQNEISPDTNHACEGFYRSGEQLCTQCEPEGFRKITYYIDRPDVMAKFSTTMIGDRKLYPYLLSNGNKTAQGELTGGRHFVTWVDPFPKPSYLFAMVAGDFDVARDVYCTQSGRNVALEIFVDKGNLKKTLHAMSSLKRAMRWDEETFNLEYDLDIYMIVAVDSFNMGAMENKGLNIFNSTYTLADQSSGTDHDFQNIEGVIGHEYFHNWTGNRVTCRDWFQLTLKEGLTVFRDQEFSSDMLSRSVKRLEDVKLLKEGQFPEDAGPLSHPIRPSSYIEINNFYTRTVYEKGAEVIRMIHTLIGADNFKRGMKRYFELFDGKAVTTEDFLRAMEDASGISLSQFANWYSRPGTPKLKVVSRWDNGELDITISQHYPPTTLKVEEGNILHMPFKIGFLSSNGTVKEELIELKQLEQSFRFKLPERPILSLNRGFSAPVQIDYQQSEEELLQLMAKDTDAYCRYSATQIIFENWFKQELLTHSDLASETLSPQLTQALEGILHDKKIDDAFKSYLLELPTESHLAQDMMGPDFARIHFIHLKLQKIIGKTFQNWFLEEFQRLSQEQEFELSPKAYGQRSLKNRTLAYLVASGTEAGVKCLEFQATNALTMTEEVFALGQYIGLGVPLEHPVIQSFYKKWQKDSLVMLKWFGNLAALTPGPMALSRMHQLEQDASFLKHIPNYLRSLYGQFARFNLTGFHAADFSGYEFLAKKIVDIDRFNPQVASRLASSFSLINKLDQDRKNGMRKALSQIMEARPSRDTFEVVSKYLAQ